MVEADVSVTLDPADRAREADDPHSLVVRFGPRQAAAARCRRRSRPVPDRLSDLRHAQRRAQQRGPGLPRADRRPARRQRPSGHRQSRAGGRPWSGRASRSTPSAISSSARTWSAPAWARPGRPRPIRRPASPGASTFPSSPSATWCARRRCCSTISASTRCSRSPAARWAACRCCNGRRAIPSACSRRCRSRPRPATRRRTSPSTRSAARR